MSMSKVLNKLVYYIITSTIMTESGNQCQFIHGTVCNNFSINDILKVPSIKYSIFGCIWISCQDNE